jgi:hypothetical protein
MSLTASTSLAGGCSASSDFTVYLDIGGGRNREADVESPFHLMISFRSSAELQSCLLLDVVDRSDDYWKQSHCSISQVAKQVVQKSMRTSSCDNRSR